MTAIGQRQNCAVVAVQYATLGKPTLNSSDDGTSACHRGTRATVGQLRQHQLFPAGLGEESLM
jgi:hypothetical protein